MEIHNVFMVCQDDSFIPEEQYTSVHSQSQYQELFILENRKLIVKLI